VAARRGAPYARAGAGGDAVTEWAVYAPHEHTNQTRSPSVPPSRSPQRRCS